MPSAPVAQLRPQGCQQAKPEKGDLCDKTRYKAKVSCIGVSPRLAVEGRTGEVPFAYRCVKKRPGEPRVMLEVGDEVECRLTKLEPVKAISVKIIRRVSADRPTAPAHSGLGDAAVCRDTVQTGSDARLPQTAPAAASLLDALGGSDGLTAGVDELMGHFGDDQESGSLSPLLSDATDCCSVAKPVRYSHDPYAALELGCGINASSSADYGMDRNDSLQVLWAYGGPVWFQ